MQYWLWSVQHNIWRNPMPGSYNLGWGWGGYTWKWRTVQKGLEQAITLWSAKFRIKRVTIKRKNNRNTCCRMRLQVADLAEVPNGAHRCTKVSVGPLCSPTGIVKVHKSPLCAPLETGRHSPQSISVALPASPLHWSWAGLPRTQGDHMNI